MLSKSTKPRILVAGIGNIFLGDDGFGCEVARRLLGSLSSADVRVEDFGIRGFDLAFALLDGYEMTILIDATPRGGSPGTVYKIAPELDELNELDDSGPLLETHGMNPLRVLAMVKSMGGELRNILIVGCEPAPLTSPDGEMGLSAEVTAGIPAAVSLVESVVREKLNQSNVMAASH